MNGQAKVLQAIGSYDLLEKIADSGMATVYKGGNRTTGQVVAVKVMPPFQADKERAFQRFAQECHILSAINDPHIVRALDFGIEGSTPYLVMEFVEGESLGQLLRREGRLPEPEAVRLIAQVALALGRAHERGLVHRNVKPDNILITAHDEAKLTDFGMAKVVEKNQGLTLVGASLGTPHFMSPEQFRNAKSADSRSDIYSLAATLYMTVTGELPFAECKAVDAWMKKLQNDFPPPRKLVPTLSEWVDWVICRGMNADPSVRPASCREFIDDLTREPFGDRPARGGLGIERADLPLPGRAVESQQAAVPTEPPVFPATPVNPSEPQPSPATRKQPIKTGVADPTEGNINGLTWLMVIFGLVAGLLCGLYFLPR